MKLRKRDSMRTSPHREEYEEMRFEQHKSLGKIQEYAWRIYGEDFDRGSIWRYFRELKEREIEEKAKGAIEDAETITPPREENKKDECTPFYSVGRDRVCGFRDFEDIEDRLEDMRLEWEMDNEPMSLRVAAKAILRAEREQKRR